jgi:hypothetical protein
VKGEGGFNEEAKDNISDGRIVEEHRGAISMDFERAVCSVARV